jgi:hypothetical protein
MLLALLLGWLFLGGHGGSDYWFFDGRTPKEMRAEVAKIVSDTEARNTTDYNLGLVEKTFENLESERSKLEKDVLTAMERHDTPSAEFNSFEARADDLNLRATKSMLDIRFVMRAQLSEHQWRSLFPPPSGR